MATLRLFIMGFAALVPNVNMDSTNIELVVSLPKADDHMAELVYERASLGRECAGGDEPRVVDGCAVCVRELPGFRVHFEGITGSGWEPSQPANGKPPASNAVNGVVPTRTNLSDFDWMPTMSSLSTTTGAIHRRFLGLESAQGLASLVLVDGRASASVYSVADVYETDETGTLAPVIHSMNFKADPTDWLVWGLKQAMADLVLVEVPLANEAAGVTLEFCLLSNPATCPYSLVLNPVGNPKRVEVLIGNSMEVSKDPPSCGDQDHHQHFYSFFDLRDKLAATQKKPYCGAPTVTPADLGEPELPCVVTAVSEPLFNPLPKPWKDVSREIWKGGLNRVICGPVLFQPPS